jgi:hypothetical protein
VVFVSDRQQEAFRSIVEQRVAETNGWVAYWYQYSHMGTWQFWFHVGMLVIPLVVLYYALDRKQAFRIGFFGYSIHMVATYLDAFGTTHGYWEYPYKLTPHLTASFGLDASLIPVSFMLLYQWTLNRSKNYYLYSILLCVAYSFAFKPLLRAMDLFALFRGMNFAYLFLAYITAALLGKWITELFAGLHRNSMRASKV